MGRPEGPLRDKAAALGLHLRSLRERSGLSYRQMAQRTGLSAATLARTADGRIPTEAALEAYVRACGGHLDVARDLRERARKRAAARPLPPRPVAWEDVTTADGLAVLMQAARLRAGNPSLRDLAATARARGLPPLAPSTVSDVLRGLRRPKWRLLHAFLQACGVSAEDLCQWQLAWARVCGGLGREGQEMLGLLAGGVPALAPTPPPLALSAAETPLHVRPPLAAVIPGQRRPPALRTAAGGRPATAPADMPRLLPRGAATPPSHVPGQRAKEPPPAVAGPGATGLVPARVQRPPGWRLRAPETAHRGSPPPG